MLLPEAIVANRLAPALTYGGANLNFFTVQRTDSSRRIVLL
jgi:glycerol-3-phosphate O-acyltransferase